MNASAPGRGKAAPSSCDAPLRPSTLRPVPAGRATPASPRPDSGSSSRSRCGICPRDRRGHCEGAPRPNRSGRRRSRRDAAAADPDRPLARHGNGRGCSSGPLGVCRKYDIAAHRRMCAAKYFLLHGAIFGKAPFASRGQRPRNRSSPLISGLSPGGGQTPGSGACRALALDRKAVAKLHGGEHPWLHIC